MNITDFMQKVKNRILKEYLEKVRLKKIEPKKKLYIIIASLFSPILIYLCLIILNYIFHLNRNELIYVISASICIVGLVTIIIGLVCIFIDGLTNLSILNFKKSSNNFFGTLMTDIPVVENTEVRQYIEKFSSYFCKAITLEEKEKILSFTDKEIEELSVINFNEQQKDYFIVKLKNTEIINYEILPELVGLNDEIIIPIQKEKEYIKEIYKKENSKLINLFGIKNEAEKIKDNIKYKLRDMI